MRRGTNRVRRASDHPEPVIFDSAGADSVARVDHRVVIVVSVHNAVVGPGREFEEFDLAETGAEGRALCFAWVCWIAPGPFLVGDVPLDVVHFDVVLRQFNVGRRRAVLVLKRIVRSPVHLVPSAQVLLPVKILYQGRPLTQSAYRGTTGEITGPYDCREGRRNLNRRPLLIGDC